MPNLPPQVQKFVGDVDKRLHEPGTITNVLGTIETKTGVKRLHILAGLVVFHALYLLFGRWAQLLCNLTGFLYPAYISIKAIESHSKEDDTQWLTYWVVFALLNVLEFFSNTILYYFPFYWLVKCVSLLYLYMPMTQGASMIYMRFIRPFHLQHHSTIDDARKAYDEHVKPN
jgi:receptor expression-enhancing protein 5/6